MKHLKKFESFTDKTNMFHVYQHPMSTSTCLYCIPVENLDEILSNPEFNIGQYQSNFKEYLDNGSIIDLGEKHIDDIEKKSDGKDNISDYQCKDGKVLYYEVYSNNPNFKIIKD